MNDFDYDIVQKKRIAHSAAKKKRGSKSKYVRLPSDNLTAAERKKLNGELKVYDWSKPITWAEFKKYPHDIQEECLLHFSETWGCSSAMMAEMFGIKPNYMSQLWTTMGLKGLLKRMPAQKDILRFREWLNADRSEKSETPTPVEAPVKEVVKIVAPPIFVNTLSKGNLIMRGTGNEIAQTLPSIFQNSKVGMRIEFEIDVEDEPVEAAESEEME